MFPIETLRQLFQQMEWADATVWETVGTLPREPVDKTLRDRLLHIHNTQRAFLYVWTNRAPQFPKAEDFADMASLREWARPFYREAATFLSELDPARLASPLTMPWAAEFEKRTGTRFAQTTLGDTIFQVTSHSTYHRGQVNTRLRELGAVPPLTDYIAWVWKGKPTLLM